MPHETRYERVQQFIRDQRRIICLENEQRRALEMEKANKPERHKDNRRRQISRIFRRFLLIASSKSNDQNQLMAMPYHDILYYSSTN